MPETYTPDFGRISGKLLSENLVRNGIDLAVDDDLLYLKVSPIIEANPSDWDGDPNYPNGSVGTGIGINTDNPLYDVDVAQGLAGTSSRSLFGISDEGTVSNIQFQPGSIITTITGPINIIPSTVDSTSPLAIFDKLATSSLYFNDNILGSVSDSNIVLEANGSGKILVQANTNIDGNLGVTGNISLDGNLSTISNLIIGDEIWDTVTIAPDFTQSIIPGQDLAYDLGRPPVDSSPRRWSSVIVPGNTNIGNLLPQNAIISEQIKVDGVNNTIFSLQSNDNLVLLPDTDILHVEKTRFYPDYFLKDYATYDVGNDYYRLNVYFNSDGTHLVGVYNRTIYHWDVPVPFDYDSRINETSTTIASLESFSFAIVISEPGDRILISGRTSTTRYISEVSLSTAWDLSTAAYVSRMSNGSTGGPTLSYNETGTRLYSIRGNGLINSLTDSETIYQYNLTTAWRISGGTLQTSSIISVEGNTIGADYSDGFSFPLNPVPGAIWFRNVSFSGNYVYFLIASAYSIYVTDAQYPGDTRDSAKIVKYELTVPGELSSGGVYVPAGDRYTFQQTPGDPITDTLAYNLKLYGDESNEDEQILLESAYLTGLLRMWRRDIHNTYIENKDTTTPVTFRSTGIGYTKFEGTNGILIPAGTNAERPATPEVGDTRWNIDLDILECFAGDIESVVPTGNYSMLPDQEISVTPTVTSGLGSGASFSISIVVGSLTVSVTNPGAGYKENDTLTISGTTFTGGSSPFNDITLTVGSQTNDGYVVATGGGETVTVGLMEDLGDIYALILG